MAKKSDKRSMAEDYIAQMEWENSHPLDRRGRPSLRHQPKWKYVRSYPRASKTPVIVWIIIIPILIVFLGFLLFLISHDDLGIGIAGGIIMLSTVVLIYFMARKPK